MANGSEAYELARTVTLERRDIAIKLFNKDVYSLGTYAKGEEVNDVHGIQPLAVIGPGEPYPLLDIEPFSFQIGIWDEDLHKFKPHDPERLSPVAELGRSSTASCK